MEELGPTGRAVVQEGGYSVATWEAELWHRDPTPPKDETGSSQALCDWAVYLTGHLLYSLSLSLLSAQWN